ncbi:MAG TPA: hypothetical protein VGK73_38435 [Polyangiaceae bacterium]
MAPRIAFTLALLAASAGCSGAEDRAPGGDSAGAAGSSGGTGGAAAGSGSGGAASGAAGIAGAASGVGGAAGAAAGSAGSGGAAGVAGTGAAGASGGTAGASGGAGTGGQTAGAAGAGSDCPPFVMPGDCTIPQGAVLPGELRCTGLYGNWETRELHCGVAEYAPAFALWSDAAEKRRFVALPPGSTVDVSDPDAFQFPVGTSFWKEFRLPAGDLAETRLLRKSDAGWIYTSYVWNVEQTNATQNNDGVPDLGGSGHTVPSRTQCKECHAGRPDYVLGWDAFLLGAGATGVTRETLVEQGLVDWTGRSDGAPNPLAVSVPGDEVERAALGYLHANCGASCHNGTAPALGRETGLFLNLDAELLESVQVTPAFATANGRTPSPNAPILDLPVPASGPFVDLLPLDPERSLLLVRMQVRGVEAQMPRLATNRVDEQGVAQVKAWIEQMTPERGYPAPSE